MTDFTPFGIGVAIVAGALVLAVLANLVSEKLRIPAPAFFLVGAALAALALPPVSEAGRVLDEHIVSIALVVILFDGGMHIGWRRFRSSAGAIVALGIAGTALTALAVAAAAHFVFGFDPIASLLLGAALSPTDPAVVFSVLGNKEIGGRAGTMLEGESGANDPVGIAIMIALLSATGTGWAAVGSGLGTFALQIGVGAVVGVAGGLGMRLLLRRLVLPDDNLASVIALAAAVFLYGIATAAQGSGFLAVFIAGILLGDLRAPYKRDIARFVGSVGSLAEIVAFTVLGLTIQLDVVVQPRILLTGLAIAGLLIFVIRPVLVGLVSLPIRIGWGERGFLLWSGLKGAVPILLGLLILSSEREGAQELYAIVFIVVLVSVVLQGSLVPLLARLLRVPMRTMEQRPWALDIRFAEQPEGLQRLEVAAGSRADGATLREITQGETEWISLASRNGRILALRADTRLQAGDIVLAQVDDEHDLGPLFDAREG
ncbi:MAG: cation:proton antiporter [Actinomycetales bacterium]|nr:cation:proton antiporter [Actinomycetales bacterium]